MNGWTKTKGGAKYSGVSERTFRDFLKQGLCHSRLKSGTILVKYSEIDQFLRGFEATENKAEKLVDEILKTV